MTVPPPFEPSTESPRASASQSGPATPGRRRRRQRVETRPHGWQRSSDLPVASPSHGSLSGRGRRRATPAGTSLLLTLIVGVLTAIGIARVRATTRVLELGAEITELTSEQARLLDERRRLAAERAYLRHPEHIGEVARNHLQMIPMSPDLVQTIRLQEPEPQQGPERGPEQE